MKQNWIIGMSGSEWDDVVTYRVFGSKNDVKKHLAALVRESKNENPDCFEYGDTSIKSITERNDGSLYAGATFSSYHNDYTATPEMEVKIL